MQTNQSLGQFEQLVLTATYVLREKAYSVTIADRVSEMANRRIMLGTVYVSLDRLERRGLLTSKFADPTPERGGKAKRYFKVTAAGRQALAQTKATAQLLIDALEDLK